MATTCTTTVSITLAAALVKALTNSNPADAEQVSDSYTLATGTGAGKANRSYCQKRTLGASANETLVLNGDATFKDAFGDAINFDNIKALAIYNEGPGALAIFGAANPIAIISGATDTIAIPAGGLILFSGGDSTTAGWEVTATTGMNLKVAADGSGAVYQILIVGEA